MLVTAEIAATWVLLATAISTGSPLLMSAIKALGALYLFFSILLFWRYRTSASGRKWIPVIFKQWGDAPMVVGLRGIAPPFGATVARGVGVVLALHTPLLMVYSVVPMLFVMPASREKSS